MKTYQKIIAIGLTILLPYSLFGKDKKEDVKYPTRYECSQFLKTNINLVNITNNYCIRQNNLNTLNNLAVQCINIEKNRDFIGELDAKLKIALEGADVEEPKFVVTPIETKKYMEKQKELCLKKAQNLAKEISANSAAPVADYKAPADVAKTIPKGMVGIGGYFTTQGGAARLNALAGVRSGKTEFNYYNRLCTPYSFSPSTKDELKALDQLLIESSYDNNLTISDNNIKEVQLKMCCENYKKEDKPTDCDKFKK